jgi:hypothetical protein
VVECTDNMSRNHESLLEFALDSSLLDDDEELLIGASQILYTHYQTVNMPKHGGSVPGHRVVRRKRELGHWKLFEDYFLDDPTCGTEFFKQRFITDHLITFAVMNNGT